jgi:hypothetical protein
MRRIDKVGWLMVAVLTLGAVPRGGFAADRSLEERVRALEKKLEQQQKGMSSEQQSVSQRIDAIENQVKEAEQTIAEKLGIDFHALLAVDYLYNFNSPPSSPGLNSARVFDNDANSFTVNDAALFISRDKPDENLGFMVDVDFGKTGQVVDNATWWKSSSSDTGGFGSSDFFNLREAYITYKVPVGDGVTLKAGKFVTLMGEEVIKTWTNFNFNISNSILFGYAIPFTHTGLLASFPVGSIVSIDAGVVNGWDDVVDNNQGKTFIGGLGITPTDSFSMYFAGSYGVEEPHNEHSKRGGLTGVFTLKASDALTFIVDADYFNESDYPDYGESALWYGVAGYAIYKATDRLTLSLRPEVFVDSDGTRGLNNVPNPNLASNAGTVWEITPTVSYQLTSGLLWRGEYRHDESNKQFFQKSGGNFVRGQDTLATELVYAF